MVSHSCICANISMLTCCTKMVAALNIPPQHENSSKHQHGGVVEDDLRAALVTVHFKLCLMANEEQHQTPQLERCP